MIRNKIKIIRTFKGLSVESISRMLQMSIADYTKLENGDNDIFIKKLSQVSEVLEVRIIDILTFTNQQHSKSAKEAILGESLSAIQLQNLDLVLKHNLDKINFLEKLIKEI